MTWHADKQQFLLDCPNEGAYKNWISQGLTADKCVVMADLRVGGKSYGPHAFLIDFRRNGKLVDGVTIGDMGVKTIGNDLDNAWVNSSNASSRLKLEVSLTPRWLAGGVQADLAPEERNARQVRLH